MSNKRKKKPKKPKKDKPPSAPKKAQGWDARLRAGIQARWARLGDDAARCCGGQGLSVGCPTCGKRWA